MIMALLLDAANIVGGLLLAIVLLGRLPRVGNELERLVTRIAAFGGIVGVLALVASGYYLIVHLVSGPRLFHFEVVGIGVGVALLWDRLTGRQPLSGDESTPATASTMLLAIFGLIAIVVGIEGLFTSDG